MTLSLRRVGWDFITYWTWSGFHLSMCSWTLLTEVNIYIYILIIEQWQLYVHGRHIIFCTEHPNKETMANSVITFCVGVQFSHSLFRRNYIVRMDELQHSLIVNSSPPGQNGRHFADDVSRCISMNKKFCILITISLKFLPKGPIDNSPALVSIMAWRSLGVVENNSDSSGDTHMRHNSFYMFVAPLGDQRNSLRPRRETLK